MDLEYKHAYTSMASRLTSGPTLAFTHVLSTDSDICAIGTFGSVCIQEANERRGLVKCESLIIQDFDIHVMLLRIEIALNQLEAS